MKFKNLGIGHTFDFISGTSFDSFYSRCVKLSARTYGVVGDFDRQDQKRKVYRVGSINCEVYHFDPLPHATLNA